MSKYNARIREEELKHRVATDWFAAYDCTRIVGNVDFTVDIPATELALGYAAEPALWAEAKAGARHDIVESFVQLILTIGRARYADELPPLFLGAFDAEKIAFIPYNAVLDVLGANDFNWNVAPSDHGTKEFLQLHALVSGTISREKLLFDFERDATELRRFIRVNFRRGREDVSKLRINKNNFTHIYRKWRDAVYPFIDAPWEMLKKNYGIYDRDFYLAEINVDDKDTSDISDDTPAADFYITFRGNEAQPYWMKRKDASGLDVVLPFGFKSGGLDAYAEFWRRYKRPPKKEYWSFIVKRLDLLVPQDVRERKGSFFTPRIWVEKSQQYLALALGENWQDDHFIWDPSGGTGNMEVGLTNKYNVFVSTLDQQDVDVIHQTFGDKGSKTLLDAHVFQFDFLNDDFAKLPAALREIINDPKKRKKLVIYFNPPYAEAATTRTIAGTGENKAGVASNSLNVKYKPIVGAAVNELFVLFLMRIHDEIPGCIVGQFSKLKHIVAPNFKDFRKAFTSRLLNGFLVPADTFDNVKGKFPIGFFVWKLLPQGLGFENTPQDHAKAVDRQTDFDELSADVYDRYGELIGQKSLYAVSRDRVINNWLHGFFDPSGVVIGWLCFVPNDFQHNNGVFFCLKPSESLIRESRVAAITVRNFQVFAMYLAIRQCIEASWLNDRDQFLFPNDGWRGDSEFAGDCLVYALFHGQNRISSADGINHWIPFTEAEVRAHERFASHFMTDFMAGKQCGFSPAAQSVLAAGRELWRYYHAQPGANPNASYYDIRAHFQGRKPNGTMKATSGDATYNALLDALKKAMKGLAKQIEPKVYEYGFLRR